MKPPYQRIVIVELAIALLGFVLLPATFIYAVDPCHIFHKPFQGFLHHGFNTETRCQNAGLVNSWLPDEREGFDSILVGASTSENFDIRYINENTAWRRTLQLIMVNMAPVEQNIMLRKALAPDNVRHVFLEILPMLHHMPKPLDFGNISKTDFFPTYLYNRSILDDYRYIFNKQNLSSAIDVFINPHYFKASIDKIRYWENQCATYNICDQFYSREDIERIQAEYVPTQLSLKSEEDIRKLAYTDFDNFIYPIIVENCNTGKSFDIFFPPFSLLWFAQLSEPDFYFELYLLRHTVNKIADCKNVRVFAFYNELWITADLSNYHDPKHFYGDIHNFVVDAMANNRNRITQDNIAAFEKTLVTNLNAYRPFGTRLYPH